MKWTDANYPLVTPASTARVLVRDADTDEVSSSLISALPVVADTSIRLVASIEALRAITSSPSLDGAAAQVAGYYGAGTAGGGPFYYDFSSSAGDNGGTVIEPDDGVGRWLRQDVTYSVDAFGAKGDNATDDTVPIQAAINAAQSAGGGTVIFGSKKYLANVSVTGNNVTLLGTLGRPETFECCLRAYDTAAACVTIGDGTTLVYANAIRGLGISGETLAGAQSPAALRYLSAVNCFATQIALCGGTKTLWMEGSDTQPVTCINISQYAIRQDNQDNVNGRGVYVRRNTAGPATYTTGISFTGGHLNGEDYGYLWEIDGEYVYFTDSYFDIYPGHGGYINVRGGVFVGAGVVWDAPSGSVIQVSENNPNLARYMQGTIRCDVGVLTFLNTTTANLTGILQYADTAYSRNMTNVDTISTYKLQVNSGTLLSGMTRTIAAINFASINAQSQEVQTVAVTGAAVTDHVSIAVLNGVGAPAGVSFDGWVSSANVVSVRAFNFSAAPVNPDNLGFSIEVRNYT